MGQALHDHADDRFGRRQHSRLQLRLPVRAMTATHTRQAILVNLSISGACLLSDLTMKEGAALQLQWGTHHTHGTVVWTAGGYCGIVFDEHISEADLADTCALQDHSDQHRHDDIPTQAAVEAARPIAI